MRRTLKIIFWSSIVLLVLLAIAPLIGYLTPLQWATANDEESFQVFRFIGILACILLTLSGTLKKIDSPGIIILKIIATIFLTCVALFVMAIAVMGDMCVHNTDKILFINKNNPSIKIILRSFGCGATDSTSPNIEVVKATYYTSHFFILSPIDTTKMDRTIWLPVNDKEQQ